MAHNLKVEVDRNVCIGSGDCARVAPTAFALDDDDRAYVLDPESVGAETLHQAERSCPSGAITVEELEAAVPEPAQSGGGRFTINASENGPYLIETGGRPVVVRRAGGEETIERPVVALCRCGQSSNKPFCDGTHKAAEFGEPASEVIFET
jgi:CDGSH iron-sulfur domain-containing protein 3